MTVAAEKRFLTQDEVAKILRRSVQSVARLRRIGELAYLPGSPVLIPEAEVTAYLERKMVQRRAPPPPPPLTHAERAGAMLAKLKRDGKLEGLIAVARKAGQVR